MSDDEWVQVAVFDDPIEARMTLDFLRDHGLAVETRGSSPEGVRNLYTPIDIRIVVRARDVEEAASVLAALRSPEPHADVPFRGSLRPAELADDAADALDVAEAPPLRTKRAPFAFVLAFLVPFGGGHFYAEHTAAGAVIAVSVLACLVLAATVSPAFGAATIALVGLDAVTSIFALRRRNARAVPPAGAQRLSALVLVALAVALGFAFSATSAHAPVAPRSAT